MRKILVSCALCAAALSASAQCAVQAQAPAAHQVVPAKALLAHPLKSPGWISSASAGTADSPLHVPGARAMQDKQDRAPEQEHPHRTRPAMLIAALALMTAIALRRLAAADS